MTNLKNYKYIKAAMDSGDNVLVITRWAALNTDAVLITSNTEIFFYERETEKAVQFANEFRDVKIWIPKSQIIYYEKNQKEITRVFTAIN